MANITLRMIYNLETGKKDIYVDFVDDLDALPIEHEQHHRELIEELLGKGALDGDDMGDVVITRVPPAKAPNAGQQEQTPEKVASGQ